MRLLQLAFVVALASEFAAILIYITGVPKLDGQQQLSDEDLEALQSLQSSFQKCVEAHRVLKPSGWLLIAEVKSRFDPTTGGADPNRFSKAVNELGFTSVSKDFSNKMFLLLYFKKKEKQNSERKEIEWPELKACLYKRR